MLHDAEDVVHPYELRIFDGLIDRAALVQLPVLPLQNRHSRWIAGHYWDEFAEAHMKELVVREAVGAAIPLAGVACAIARKPLAQLAANQDGKPFAGSSMTEDYELGLRLGALGHTPLAPTPAPLFYPPTPALDEWPLSRIAATSLPPMRAGSPVVLQSRPIVTPPALDRVQMTSWALLRGQNGRLGPSSLGSGGNLGGSQGGARLSYNFTRQIAATLRTTSDVGRATGEVAAGVRVRPLQSIPLWFTIERRQAISRFGGRNAFALFAEGGVWRKPIGWQFDLDAYLQGGVVDFRDRDMFVDGGAAVSRPVYRQFSAGFGVWGGAQPGVYRVDVGPRVSMQVRPNVRIHLDWRQRLAGNAEPGSGPAVTLAGDF